MPAEQGSLLLPEGARLLHIGPQKTGTTTLQVAMHRARSELRAHGVVYPGTGTRPREGVWAALGTEIPSQLPTPRIERWHDLVREVREAGDLRVCVSTEDFAKAELDGAVKVVEALGGDRAHVVAVVRRLDALLPSQWQQRVRLGVGLSYEEWLEIVLGDDRDHPVWRNIWTPHDVEALVERWVTAAGPERFTLVVADENDRRLLSRTVEQMLDLPDGMLAPDESALRNESLTLDRVELIRRLNLAFGEADSVGAPVETELRARVLAALKAAPRSPNEPRIPELPPWAADRVAELSARRADAVAGLGVRVVGDPEHLRAPVPSEPGEHDIESSAAPTSTAVPAELVARAIEETIRGAVDLREAAETRHRRELAALRRRLRRVRKRAAASPAGGRGIAGGPAARSVLGRMAALGRRGVRWVRRRLRW